MIKVFEAFAGIGTQRMALRNLGIEHEVVAISEIDKFAIKSYEAIHGEVNNLGDISKIDVNDVADHDLFTYSFPCQDLSTAGKQAGLIRGVTRSGLLYECEKIIKHKRPKYLLMENVKALTNKKHKQGFEDWLEWLEDMGYTNYWQILNAKDFCIPQNRERVFVVSILYPHDPYVFPSKQELKLQLSDLLEEEVDEKFYLSKERIGDLIWQDKDSNIIAKGTHSSYRSANDIINPNKYSSTLLARDYKDPKRVMIGASRGRNPNNPSDRTAGSPTEQRLEINQNGTSNTITTVQKDNYVVEPNKHIKPINPLKGKTNNGWHFEQEVYDDSGIARALKAGGGSGNIPKTIVGIPIKDNTDQGYLIAKEEFGRMGRQAVETYNEKQPDYGDTVNPFNKTVDNSNNCPTITTRPEGFKTAILPVTQDYRIRKLTPLECWRLMGIKDEDFYKAQAVNSNSQLYKQAGNAIVVNVLEAIFRSLLIKGKEEDEDTNNI